MLPSEDTDRRILLGILSALAALWLGLRFVESASPPPPTVTRALAGVRAAPSPETGRLEVTGLPSPHADPAGLLTVPAIENGAARLREEVDAVNGSLTLRLRDVTRRLERADDGSFAALHVGGWLVPFYGRDASLLLSLEGEADDRPWDALQDLLRVLETRLEAPPALDDADDPARRRELTRFFRETGDGGRDAEATVAAAVDAFRADARETLRAAEGPFRRRGAGRLLETVLAALLGAAVRAAVRRRPGGVGRVAPLAVAPVLAVGLVLALERTPVLAAGPLTGTPLRFLPLAFMVGFVTEAILVVASRLDRLFVPDPAPVVAAAPATPLPAPAARRPEVPAVSGRETEVPASADRPPGFTGGDAVRDLAREVMTRPATDRPPRSEREVEQDPGVTRERPSAPPAGTARLPFSRKR